MSSDRELLLAQQMVRRRQYFDAMDRFRRLLQENVLSFPDIVAFLYKRLIIDYDNLHLRVMLSDLYLLNRNYSSAVEELEEAFKIDPEFTQIYFILSKIYTRDRHEKNRIKTIFEKAFNQGVHDSAILDLLPKLYLEDNDVDKSISMYQKLSKDNPKSISYKKTLLELYIQSSQLHNALRVMCDISKLFPDSTQDLVRKAESLCDHVHMDSDCHRLLVDLNIQAMNPIAASRHVGQMIEINPNFCEDGIHLYQEILSLFPDTKSVLLQLSGAYVANGQLTEAVTTLKRVVTHCAEGDDTVISILEDICLQNPDHFSSRELLIELYIRHNYIDQSINLLEELIEKKETPLDSLLELIEQLKSTAPSYSNKSELMKATLYFSHLRIPDAEDSCQRLFSTEYEIDARLLLAESKLSEGLIDIARRILAPALKAAPHNKDIHHLLKLLLMAEEKEMLAYNQHERSTESKELHLIGLEYMRHLKFYDALEAFQKIPARSSHHFYAQFLIGRCFLECGRFELAINQFIRLLKHERAKDAITENHIRYFLGITYMLYGKIAEAITQLECIVGQDYQFSHAEMLITQLKSRNTLDIRGRGLSGVFYIPQSIYFSCDVENSENHAYLQPHQRVGLANSHNNDAVQAALNHNWKSAESGLRLAIQLDPEYTISYSNLSYVLSQDHRLPEALDLLDKAESLNPNLDIVYLQKALIKCRQGQYEHARRELDTAISLAPEQGLSLLNLGLLELFQEKYDAAFEQFKSCIESSPQLYFLVKRAVAYMIESNTQFSHWLHDISFTIDQLFPREIGTGDVLQSSLFELEQGRLF